MRLLKFTAALLLVVLMNACTSDPSTPASQSGMVTVPSIGDSYVKPIPVDHNILAPIIAHWEVQAALKITDSAVRENLEGAWFNLNLDQTFTFGQFEDELGQGTYNYQDSTQIIDLFFNPAIAKVPNQFKIFGIGAYDGSTLIWLGNTPKNPNGMQVKMTKKLN